MAEEFDVDGLQSKTTSGLKGILRATSSGPRSHTQQQITRNTNEYVDARTHWLTCTLGIGITVIHGDKRTTPLPAPAESWNGVRDIEHGRYEGKSEGTLSSAQSKELQAFFQSRGKGFEMHEGREGRMEVGEVDEHSTSIYREPHTEFNILNTTKPAQDHLGKSSTKFTRTSLLSLRPPTIECDSNYTKPQLLDRRISCKNAYKLTELLTPRTTYQMNQNGAHSRSETWVRHREGGSRVEPWPLSQGVVWSNHPPRGTKDDKTNSTTPTQTTTQQPQAKRNWTRTTRTPSAVWRVSHGGQPLSGDRNPSGRARIEDNPPPRNTARGLRSETAIDRRKTQRSLKRWAARRGKRADAHSPPRPPVQEAQELHRDPKLTINLPKQRTLRLATLNLCGLKQVGKREEVERWMNKQNIDILCAQETHAPSTARRKGRNTLGT